MYIKWYIDIEMCNIYVYANKWLMKSSLGENFKLIFKSSSYISITLLKLFQRVHINHINQTIKKAVFREGKKQKFLRTHHP